jgi:hypothetical protein
MELHVVSLKHPVDSMPGVTVQSVLWEQCVRYRMFAVLAIIILVGMVANVVYVDLSAISPVHV